MSKGLEGVVVSETRLSKIFGDEGRLVYCGYEIEDLAENASFEEVCHLLWHGELPDREQLNALRAALSRERVLPDPILEMLRLLPRSTHPMAALRTAASAMAAFDSEVENMDEEANRRKAVRITASLPTATAAFERLRNGREPLAPRAELGHAANFLYMLNGREPDALRERIMDVALTLHAEHGMNASTFSARVTVATLADMHSAIVSAIGTLKGPLHGGANQRVMDMLQSIQQPDDVEAYIRTALDRKEKIMGFGHRVYRALDPRAPILRDLAERLAREAGETRWLELAERIVEVMRVEMEARRKRVYPNVDFFSAPVYFTLGIPTDQFTNIFACARAAGWTAHVLEQLQDNRLIRPRSEYVGATGRRVVPIDQRG